MKYDDIAFSYDKANPRKKITLRTILEAGFKACLMGKVEDWPAQLVEQLNQKDTDVA